MGKKRKNKQKPSDELSHEEGQLIMFCAIGAFIVIALFLSCIAFNS
jgi:hypothetical protein